MLRVSLLSFILLFSSTCLQASFAGSAQKKDAEKPLSTLREKRAAMMKNAGSMSIFTVVASAAQVEKVAQVQAFSKLALKGMNIEISEEEAQDLQLPKKTVALNLIGKPIGGSVCVSGQTMTDINKLNRLGYKNKDLFTRGQLVVVSQENRCYYGLIVCKNPDDSYQVQVTESEVAKVGTGDIASK